MREAKPEPDVIYTTIHYVATVSACRKGGQWQHALSVLSGMWKAKLEPDVISCSAGISACGMGRQWQQALALLTGMWGVQLEPNSGQLQRWDQRVRKGRAVAAGAGSAEPDVGGETGARRHIFHYSAGISACEKGEQWHWALALLSEMCEAKLEPDVIPSHLHCWD
ncbi:unnamed protein product [Prorocentrum cordatum]|uniref:Pentatricopeptide repeat-containing protein, chloroplastic n=1 Tax=Prorocentrum cordatum TaxID=2364126 RepID=A0ABN9S2S3_9DINO|nr:unnamed protein product [Polarella glacialis]